ncbi:MAG: SCP2 sterol-binding domain-containing protein [Gammaproteobacteria bacterium]|nr:SCP2 sterol-binding domain-containing protein [Gammaproteobacteria bacterium]
MAWMLVLEEFINRGLGLDPAAAGALGALSGRNLGIEVRGLGLRMQVFIAADGVHLASWPREGGDAPDTIISGPPLALLRLFTSTEPYQSLFRGEVEVTGDTRLLERLRGILAAADLDWEEPLTRLLGDTVGHQMARGVRGLGRWSDQTRASLAEDTRDFLEEESRLVVREEEVRAFSAAADILRDDVARLEARLERLEGAAGGDPEEPA